MSYKDRKLNRKIRKLVKTGDQYTASRLASPDFGTPKMSRYEKRKLEKLKKTNKQIKELKAKNIVDNGTFNNSTTMRMADSPTMSFKPVRQLRPVKRPVNTIATVGLLKEIK